jgi:hypothetical protein
MIAAALFTPKPSGEDIFSGTMGTLRTGTIGEFSYLVYNLAGGE